MIKLKLTAEWKRQLKQIDRMFSPYNIKYRVKYTGKEFVNTLNKCLSIQHERVVTINEKGDTKYDFEFMSKQLQGYWEHIEKNTDKLFRDMTDDQIMLMVAPLMASQPREYLDETRQGFVDITKVIIGDIPEKLLRASDFMGNFCSFAGLFADWWLRRIKMEQEKQVKTGRIPRI